MENKLQPNEYKVMSLISERLEIGRKRYGGDIPLNGEKHRDNLKEAIEEAADLSIYATSLLLEEESHLKRYEKAFKLLMEWYDYIPYNAKLDLDKEFEELGL